MIFKRRGDSLICQTIAVNAGIKLKHDDIVQSTER